jgi:hypothetical protein
MNINNYTEIWNKYGSLSEYTINKKYIDNIFTNNIFTIELFVDNRIILYILEVKIIENNLYIIIYNSSVSLRKILHIKIEDNIYNNKFIKIFRKNNKNIISLVENNKIMVYTLNEIILNSNLVCLFDTRITYNNNNLYYENKLIEDELIECKLFSDKYVMMFGKNKNNITKLLFISKDGIKELLNKDNVKDIKFYNNGNIIILFNEEYIYYCDITNMNKFIEIHNINTYSNNITKYIEDIILVDNYLFIIKETDISLLNIDKNILKTFIKFDYNNYINFNIINYTELYRNIHIENTIENFYVLTIFDKDYNIKCWLISMTESKCNIIDIFKIDNNMKLVNIENNKYYFATNEKVYYYNFNNIITIKLCELFIKSIRKQLDNFYKNTKKYKINIIGSDKSKKTYELDGRIILSDKKEYDVNVNSNMNILQKKTSIDIYQQLFLYPEYMDNIIDNIFEIQKHNGIQYIMEEILIHIYDYIRVITFNNNKKERNKTSDLKAMYMGYILIMFIVKYYITLIQLNNTIVIKNKLAMNRNIYKTFIESYEIFNDTIDIALNFIKN